MTTSICFAADNSTTDSDTLEVDNDASMQTTNTKTSTGTLSDLKNEIENSQGYLNLSRDYVYDSSTDSDYKSIGLTISGSDIDIDGKNHSIDMKSMGRFITSTNSKFNMTNLTIKNTLDSAFTITNSSLITSDVTFINENNVNSTAVIVLSGKYNSTHDSFINLNNETASVVYAVGSSVDLVNSTFDINDKQTWGAINVANSVLHVINTTFSDMKSKYATAVYGRDSLVVIRNTTFKNLEADLTGGALALKNVPSYTVISGCDFINVTSGHNGGAIFSDTTGDDPDNSGETNIRNTTFTNCSSEFGGAILHLGGKLTLINTTFSDNEAEVQGGAIYTSHTDLSIVESELNNNSVLELYENYNQGGAIYADKGNIVITEVRFQDNEAIDASDVFLYDSNYTITDSYFSGDIHTMFDGNDTSLSNNTFLKKNTINSTPYIYLYDSEGANITYNPVIIDSNLSKADYFNLVDYGLVTPVKDQGSMGACWSFGVTGSLESAFLKATNKTLLLDISETNMQDASLRYSMYGIENSIEGGLPEYGAAYMLSWIGATTSDINEYDELGKISPLIDNGDKYHIQNIAIIPSRENVYDNQKLKDALIEYGALAISVHGARIGEEYNPKTNSAYYNNKTKWGANADHTVTLVGWNDSYSKDNFATTPPGDGAWIIKNSWGTDWGDDGYYYVSYYDTSVGTSTNLGFIIDGNHSYQKNYQHDIIGDVNFRDIEENISYANNFTSTGDELIAAIGTYMNKTGDEYFINIYINESCIYTQKGIANFTGYQTIKLNNLVPIHEGDYFIVEVGSGNLVPIAQLSRQHHNGNISFLVSKGQFIDLSSYNRIPSLKAYTITDKSHMTYNNTQNIIQAQYYDVYGNRLSDTEVILKVNDQNYTTSTNTDGEILLNLTLPAGENNITLINPVNGEEHNITITMPSDNNTSENSTNYEIDHQKTNNHPSINQKTVKKLKNTKTVQKNYTVKVHAKEVFHGKYFTVQTLNTIFSQNFTNGHLIVYIDGKIVFNATINDDITTIIFEIINSLLGNHELKVEFTVNNQTKTYTENITIE